MPAGRVSDRRKNKWDRLPACHGENDRLKAYPTINPRHLFFRRSQATGLPRTSKPRQRPSLAVTCKRPASTRRSATAARPRLTPRN